MDTRVINSLFDELEKIAEGDNRITKERLKRLAIYGGAGAAGMGVGYGVGGLLGPIEKKLVRWGVGPGAAKVLKYGPPISAGLGAALLLTRKHTGETLMKKIREGNKQKSIGP